MRLVALELSGFRGFAKTQAFDLDADAIVVVGANGNGKTSLFDGILWAICGRIPRLAEESQRVLSLYTESGQARAALTLRDGQSRKFKVTRSYDGSGTETKVSLETPDGNLAGPSAEGKLLELLWPDAQTAAQPLDALASVMTRSVYLQQDVLRHFIEPADDHDRFSSVSELFGAGRVTELQSALERAKKAWTTSTNQRASDLEITQTALNTLEARARDLLARAAQELPPVSPEVWSNWWAAAAAIGLKATTPELASRDAARSVDLAIKELEVRRATAERRLQALRSLHAEIEKASAMPPMAEPEKLRAQSVALEAELKGLKLKVTDEQARLAEQRRTLVALQQKDEQLRALASLALQHLGEQCPVCTQAYDRDRARRHLESLLNANADPRPADPDRSRLDEMLGAVAAKEKDIGNLELAIRKAERESSDRELLHRTIETRLKDLSVTVTDGKPPAQVMPSAIAETDAVNSRLKSLQQEGEALALRLAQSAAQASLAESRNEAERLRRAIAEQQKIVAARNGTGDMAQRVIEGLREAAAKVVEERLLQISPVLQGIYARIDPHPAFASVEFLSRITKGRGLLSTVVRDPVENKHCPHPPSVLSSSQVNALAVSIFLSFNLGIARPALSAVLLDDPLQSLDDVNLLGLVDLLRRTKDRRQLCVSTHDPRFANLLTRKLRPSEGNGRTIVIELEGWSREGPTVDVHDVKGDSVALRLVAS